METAILQVSPGTGEDTVRLICSSFEEKLGRKIDFRVTEKKELIGGFIAKIDGKPVSDEPIIFDPILKVKASTGRPR